MHPGGADLVERAAKANPIDVRIGGEPRDQHRYIVVGAFAIGGLRE